MICLIEHSLSLHKQNALFSDILDMNGKFGYLHSPLGIESATSKISLVLRRKIFACVTNASQGMSANMFSVCSRPHLKDTLRENSRDLGSWTLNSQIPIAYSERYNFTFWGVEKLHPFDSCKFRTIIRGLASRGCLDVKDCVEPREVEDEILLDVHTQEYLQKLKKDKCYVVQVIHEVKMHPYPRAHT